MPHIFSKGAPRRRLPGLIAAISVFLRSNRRLMLFLCLFLGGVIAGILLFLGSYKSWHAPLRQLLTLPTIAPGFAGAARTVLMECFSAALLLLLLFLAGLCTYGLPVTLVVPFFYGLGLGVSEAYYYAADYGILFVCALVLPRSLLVMAALLIASAEGARFSLLLSGQLLPKSVRIGGLWQDFRMYLVRFLLCAVLIAASGSLQVILRLSIGRFVT